jgi:vacuolar-type H+-ATPase subunit I/STV1
MANIVNINNAATVTPAGAKFLVIKDGKIAHCDISGAIAKAESFKQSVIDEAIKKSEETVKAMAAKIEACEKKIAELKDIIESMTVEAVAVVDEEAKVSKAAKKTKKSAE